MQRIYTLLYLSLSLLFLACSSDDDGSEGIKPMHFVAIHPSAVSRADASGFETGDCIGVFVTADTAALQVAGNKVSNEPLQYDGRQWSARRQLYWDDGVYNVCAYYPHFVTVGSIDDLDVAVATDQSLGKGVHSSAATSASLSAYEASDILYARTEGVAATDDAVPLRFVHTMSRLVIRLVKGEDYEGELPRSVDVYVHNTVPEATLNLHNGIVTKSIKAQRHSIKARQESDYTYAAVIVPQRIANRVPLLEVDINGVSYLCEATFTFSPGMQHVVNFILDKNPEQSQITIGGEVSKW